MVPLITIGIFLVTAQGVLTGLAELRVCVSAQSLVLISGVMFGAGTDYAVFLISRYHDYVPLRASLHIRSDRRGCRRPVLSQRNAADW